MLKEPSSRAAPAVSPTATFPPPLVIASSASTPKALFETPVLGGGVALGEGATPPSARAPTALHELAVVPLKSAPEPTAVFWLKSTPAPLAAATSPTAVLPAPVVLLNSALSPKALLLSPSTLSKSELAPTALLNDPVPTSPVPTLENSANVPTAVLLMPSLLVKSAPDLVRMKLTF